MGLGLVTMIFVPIRAWAWVASLMTVSIEDWELLFFVELAVDVGGDQGDSLIRHDFAEAVGAFGRFEDRFQTIGSALFYFRYQSFKVCIENVSLSFVECVPRVDVCR